MGDAVTMIKIDYIIDEERNSHDLLAPARIKLLIDGNNIAIDEYGCTLDEVMIFRPFYGLLSFLEQKKWREMGVTIGDSYTRLLFWNVSRDMIKIAFQAPETVEIPDMSVFSENEIFKVDKNEFRNEVFRVLGEYIEEMGWRDSEKYRTDISELEFVEFYDRVKAIYN